MLKYILFNIHLIFNASFRVIFSNARSSYAFGFLTKVFGFMLRLLQFEKIY